MYVTRIHNTQSLDTVKATDVASWLLSHGITDITTEELAGLIGVPKNQVRQRMAPLVKRCEIVSPARGLWIPVPFEYRQWGAPETVHYIDAMMKHLETDYYIGWMTAASFFGASHHAPQVFQVATSKTVSNRIIGRSDMRFFQRSNVGILPTTRINTQTGTVTVSTRAATMLSAASDISLVAGLDNAANIIIELSETDEPFLEEVVASAHLFPISAVRRLGWILESFTSIDGLEDLRFLSSQSDKRFSKLSVHHSYSNKVSKNWSLDINAEVEPDI
ncbi:MAG: type IV toxin-antitoxin system AbiEi family antitoxin [Coriobacteriia bacterium]|nr:type IV toxin-antitoxin system AbiEi family antitoxin [Coriobacteriia bacterium]